MRSSAILIALTIASCLALSVSAASKLNYHLIKSSDYGKISQLTAIRDYGVNLILKEAIAEKKLPNTTYHLVANNSIYNATNGTYVYYKFNLTYKDAKGDKVYPQFVVQYNKVTKAKKLQGKASASIKLANSTSSSGSKSNSNNTSSHSSNSSSSHASSSHSSNSSSAVHSTNNTSNYTKVPASHYNNSVIHKALMYGVNIAAKKAIADGHLPKSTYNVLAINSIYQEVLANSTNYKFDVDIQDVNKTFIADAIYTVHHNKASGANSVTKLAYRVLPHSSK